MGGQHIYGDGLAPLANHVWDEYWPTTRGLLCHASLHPVGIRSGSSAVTFILLWKCLIIHAASMTVHGCSLVIALGLLFLHRPPPTVHCAP